uniref:Vacuolar protein sorting-associated protein 8 homolog n=1 Tax=Eptatretus burgeri TaxID=7764 RepID=A0A8C4QXP9_EPTBU
MMSSEESSPHRSVDLLVGDEIEELDDKEFELPPVETPPTLESILNEVDDEEEEGFGGHEFGPFLGDGSDSASLDTASLASTDSGERSHSRSRRVERSSSSHGVVLRHATLKGISAQLVSAAEKADAGNPTAMAVSEVIAIGTAHGLVLVFDPQQILKMSLGSLSTGVQYGSVSALSINNNCSRLIVGHAHGQITMWDLLNGKLLRTIIDAHPPGNAILHIKVGDFVQFALNLYVSLS